MRFLGHRLVSVAVVLCAAGVGLAGGLGPPLAGAETSTVRLAGDDRYDTAVEISRASFDPGVAVAFVATGVGFPDALAGGAAGASVDGPVLLVPPGGIPAAVATELQRLAPRVVIVLGGPSVVSEATVEDLEGDSHVVERVAGTARFETAAAVSSRFHPGGSETAIVASGTSFADALAAAPYAGALGAPLLLVSGSGVPAVTAAELDRLGPKRIVVVGGPAAVSEQTRAELAVHAPVVERISGTDRYATSAAIADAQYPSGSDGAWIATGASFADALASGPAAAASSAPVLLARRDCLSAPVRASLNRSPAGRVVLVGGASVLSSSIEVLRPCDTLADAPDDAPGRYQTHVIYAVPADGQDRGLDLTGEVQASVSNFQEWFSGQSGGTTLAVDTHGGYLDVTFLRMSRSDAELAATGSGLLAEINAEIKGSRGLAPNKMYAVYYDGGNVETCGGGFWPAARGYQTASMYLRGRFASSGFDCSTVPLDGQLRGTWDYGMIHELFHNLYAPAPCAPHEHSAGHVADDRFDIMWAGPEPWGWPPVLDAGGDDYWDTGLSGCTDLADSAFLDPLPTNPQLPPGFAKE